MEVESVVVEARTHGRYLLRPSAAAPRGILVGFHGYLENAERHLAELVRIPGAGSWTLVAIDALHAFYSRSSGSGTVVRGWMTRELREQAIEDNVLYVRGILEAVRARSGWRLPVAVLGFSQGAAMAWRSALLAGHEIAGAIALGGDVPPELGELPESSPFPRVALLARGDADDWYTADRLEADLRLLAARATRVEALTFAGGHEWTDEFRAAAGALLAGLTGVEGSARAAAARRPTPAP